MPEHRYPRRFVESDSRKGKIFCGGIYAIEVEVAGGPGKFLFRSGTTVNYEIEASIEEGVTRGVWMEVFDHHKKPVRRFVTTTLKSNLELDSEGEFWWVCDEMGRVRGAISMADLDRWIANGEVIELFGEAEAPPKPESHHRDRPTLLAAITKRFTECLLQEANHE